MKKILFVCHGNICRSPMAEFVMKDLVRKAGLENQFYIESAATSTEEIGNEVYPPAKRKLAEHGISCKRKTASQMRRSDCKGECGEEHSKNKEVMASWIQHSIHCPTAKVTEHLTQLRQMLSYLGRRTVDGVLYPTCHYLFVLGMLFSALSFAVASPHLAGGLALA